MSSLTWMVKRSQRLRLDELTAQLAGLLIDSERVYTDVTSACVHTLDNAYASPNAHRTDR